MGGSTEQIWENVHTGDLGKRERGILCSTLASLLLKFCQSQSQKENGISERSGQMRHIDWARVWPSRSCGSLHKDNPSEMEQKKTLNVGGSKREGEGRKRYYLETTLSGGFSCRLEHRDGRGPWAWGQVKKNLGGYLCKMVSLLRRTIQQRWENYRSRARAGGDAQREVEGWPQTGGGTSRQLEAQKYVETDARRPFHWQRQGKESSF